MPTLPTLTVTSAQASKIQAAYGDAVAYRKWLRNAVVSYVLSHQSDQIDAANQPAKDSELSATEASLPTVDQAAADTA